MENASSHKHSRDGVLANWLRGLFSGEASGFARRGRRKAAGHHGRRLRFEACEPRQMLSSVGFSFDAGVLDITGSAGADQVSVVATTSYLDLYVGGTFSARLTNANSTNVSTITFDGAGGNDSLTVKNVRPADLAINLTGVETLSATGTKNVAVDADGALNLGTCSISGTLEITAAGELTQTGQVVVAKAATLDVDGNDITLTNAANNFGTQLSVANAQNVSLRDVNAIVLGNLMVAGDLSIQANLNSTSRVAISQFRDTSIQVGGATTLTVGPASTITLNNADNTFDSALSITAASTATIRNDSTLGTELGESRVTRNLTVTSASDVSQTGPLVVGQTAAISAVDCSVDLSADGNNFRTVAIKGVDVLLNDVNAVILGASTVTGTLGVTTDGTVSQSGAVAVAGAATLTVGDTNDVTLTNSANDLFSVDVEGARNVSLRDKNALALGHVAAQGNLTVIAGTDITQIGDGVSVALNTTLTAGTGASNVIALGNTSNDFNVVSVTKGRNVTLGDANELELGTSKVSGNLTVDAGGNLTQLGAVTVGGIATFSLAAGDLTLSHSSNNFATVVVTSAPGDVWLRDTNAMVLGNVTVAGDLTLQANLNSTNRVALSQSAGTKLTVGGSTSLAVGSASTITLNKDNTLNGVDGDVSVRGAANATLTVANSIVLGESNVTGNLTVAVTAPAAGAEAITQDGPVVVGRVASLAAAAADIVLADENNFSTLAVTAARNVRVNDIDALKLGAFGTSSGHITGTLDVTAAGAITQTGAIYIDGVTTLDTGDANDIVLNSSNDFASVAIVSGNNVVLRDSGALNLGASQIGGNLTVTAGGVIGETGVVEVGGNTTLTATTAINLNAYPNRFNGLSVPAIAGNVSVANDGALTLGTSNITGSLTVLANGGILQSGGLVVSGTASLEAPGGAIQLDNAYNDFGTSVTVPYTTGAATIDVTLKDRNTLVLAGIGTLAQPVGTLKATAGADLSQSAPLYVSGGATIATNLSALVVLDDALNSIGGDVSVTSANNVWLKNAGALSLGTWYISGNLDVTAGGNLTQAVDSEVVILGNTVLHMTTRDTTLANAGNDFGTLNVASGNNVTLQDANSIDLGASHVSAALRVTAAGAIADSGTVRVDGNATLKATDGANRFDIALDTGDYRGTLSLTGNNVSVVNDHATVLGDASVAGDLTVVTYLTPATGNSFTNQISASPENHGILVVGGVTTLNAGTSPLTLNQAGCTFSGGLYLTGVPVTVTPAAQAPVLDLDGSTAGVNCTVSTAKTDLPAGVSVVKSDATLTDADSLKLYSLTVRITDLQDGVNESLAATTAGTSIAASYDSATGTLRLSGFDTVANYLTVLKSVTYANSLGDTATGTSRTITFVANDGVTDSATATTTLSLT